MPDLLFGLRAMMERMAREKEKLNLAGLQCYVEQWKIFRARIPKQSKGTIHMLSPSRGCSMQVALKKNKTT